MKKIFFVLGICLLFFNCQKENPYLIEKNKLGKLTNTSRLNEVKRIFSMDSVVKKKFNSRFKSQKQDIEIYTTGGELIAVLEPRINNDSTSTFKQVRLIGEVFKTSKGLGPASTFKDMYQHYTISNIQNAISNIIVSVDELGIYASINKKHLPSDLRYDLDLEIDATQIPDNAPFQYFWLSFEEEK